MYIIFAGDLLSRFGISVNTTIVFEGIAKIVSGNDFLSYGNTVSPIQHTWMTGYIFGQNIYEHLPMSFHNIDDVDKMLI